MTPQVALELEIGLRFILVGVALASVASGLNLVRLRPGDRVHWVAVGWSLLVLALLLLRAVGLRASESLVRTVSCAQYTVALLQVPLALVLIEAPTSPRARRAMIAVTTGIGAIPWLGRGFVASVEMRQDLLGVDVPFGVPGPLALALAPYGLLVGAYVVRSAYRRRASVDPTIRRLMVAVALTVVPAGTNDLLMGAGLVRSLLAADVAACSAVLGLAWLLAQRSSDAHTALLSAIDQQIREVAQGERELLTTSRLAVLGRAVESLLSKVEGPLSRLATDVSTVDAGLRQLRAARLERRLWELGDLMRETGEAVRRAEATVATLADYCRLPEPERAPTTVRPLVEQALRIVQNDLRHRALLVTRWGEVPQVRADRRRLVEVFVNLLTYSAHRIPQARWGEGQVTVEVEARDATTVVVSIGDDGPAVPDDVVPRLFDPYVGHAATSGGLGLALSHRVVTSMGGRIGVNATGAGTVISVSLPVWNVH